MTWVDVTMTDMTRTAYLRIYQPLSEAEGLVEPQTEATDEQQDVQEAPAARRWLLRSDLPSLEPLSSAEGAFVRRVGDQVLICPWRTRLRMLAGLLAFRGSVPDEVADAFVGEDHAQRAAHELARLEESHPEVRNHIIHANWHVPLRWFACFGENERILTEDRHGLRIRYETSLSDAKSRLSRALRILETSWIDESVTSAVRELREWFGEFPEEGLVELDYGTVAGLFTHDELLEDESAADVWGCLEALEEGDVVRAGKAFGELTEKWTEIRSLEVVN